MSRSARSLTKRALGYGQLRGQRLFERLHVFALHGMNVGTPAFPHSGELAVFPLVARDAGAAAPVVVDAGAHVGAWALAAASALPRATVHALEPAAETHARLVRAVAGEPRVRCHRIALGERSGTIELFADRELSDAASVYGGGGAGELREEVEVVALDELCEREGVERVALLKLDVEGHELAALHGARGLLAERRIDWVQFEFGARNVESRTYLRDFFELLGDGYRLGRVVQDGVRWLPAYDPWLEVHPDEPANYVARRTG